MPRRIPSIILADDHPLMLEGLAKVLARDFEVVATVEDGDRLVAAARRLQPDLVLVDVSMPSLDGIEATRQLRGVSPGTRAVVLSLHSDVTIARKALAAGAWAYVPKTAPPDEIILALREASLGRIYLSPHLTPEMMAAAQDSETPAFHVSFTPREEEVAQLVGQGLSNAQIAESLGVSVTTVRTHLSSIYAKLGNHSRVELALVSATHPPLK